jgi:hypothetical protein
MQPIGHRARLRERIEDLLREIGTLQLAFVPLDSVLWNEHANRIALVLTFVLVGLLLIVLAFLSETRRIRG